MAGFRQRIRRSAVLGAATIAILIGLPVAASATPAYVPITGAGSTWSATALDNWRQQAAQFGMQVGYSPVGSTTGRAQFKQGAVDFAATDIPYGQQGGGVFDPPPARGFAYVPDLAGGVGFMYNLRIGPKRVTNLRLSGPVIAGIFTGTITEWDDPAIAADNPGLTLPAIAIVPVVRSDASGATSQFTRWMTATQNAAWTAYCERTGLSPCAATSVYPVAPGSGMVSQGGDLGVSGYVSQAQAVGTIGITETSFALEAGFPVAKMLNAAGFYTAPTADNVGISLLDAEVDMDSTDPDTFLTEDLSRVYTDPDPRTYPLSYYSYLVVPTGSTSGLTSVKGFSLADFAKFALCQGQREADALGYAALPMNLVQAGLTQLRRIPGANIANLSIQTCADPTFFPGGADTLTTTTPLPADCDKQGPAQCVTPPVTTFTTLSADPVSAPAGTAITLTATVSAFDADGVVRFSDGDTTLGTSPVEFPGTATLTVASLAAGSHPIIATFEPADAGVFSESASDPVTVTIGGAATSGQETILAGLPSQAAGGALTLSVDGTPVTMSPVQNHGFGLESTGTLSPVIVTDSRTPDAPGWTATGSASAFTSGTNSFSGNALGWQPITETLPGVTAGATVEPGDPGLGTPATLAEATAGHGEGTTLLGGSLDLLAPVDTPPGSYSATLTITLLGK